ncbi:M28 family metallopeptidase [Homoserinimonas hongtaonis]|uniref:Aminopeptidase n=1 Tax=Homoserinimonas hongtaonis TaxID=2079791 RepID=A0A2U1SYC9_9MICO|nr:M28 family metallopeptidase [Salinibacterium hongtaonis]PWB96635.1 aminopeptidase [Salinibacterium hongtaonis]
MGVSRSLRRVAIITGAGLVASIGLTATALPAWAGGSHGPGGGNHGRSISLAKQVTAKNILGHLNAFQKIADANGGNRQSGAPGHVASAEYVEFQLRKAGYKPVRQEFSYEQFVEGASTFAQVTPNAVSYVDQTDYDVMDYSGAGTVTGEIVAVDVNLAGDRVNTSGCEAEDFAGFAAGSIALVQRGTCTFGEKVANATAAGAAAVIVFNQGNGEDRSGLLFGTLSAPQASIPALGAPFAVGESLAAVPGTTVSIAIEASVTTVNTFNVIADTKKGNPDATVVVGAHLDGVAEGPGINDNASGSGAILETAIQLAKSKATPQNRVRFAFWSGEEDGLLGSTHYVSQLTEAEIAQHAANLNFDMVGSPNFVRFVYDGDGSEFGSVGPEGSAQIEALFSEFFAGQGLASEPTEFDGRSDYAAFIDAGIAAGGLFTGADGVKTEDQAAVYGGTAGETYDQCYHSACDTIANINVTVLDQMADAIAYATQTYADLKKGHKPGKPGKPGKGGHGGWGHHDHHGPRLGK